jgi:hypothetical protein
MADEIKNVEAAADAKVQGFFAKQVAWIKTNYVALAIGFVIGVIAGRL